MLPPGPRMPRVVQALRYTFDLPRFFDHCHARYGATWTLRLHGFPPAVITADRDAIRRLFTGDPLTKRHGNDVLEPIVGRRSVMLLEPLEHLARRRLELPAFHGDAVRRYTDGVRARIEREVGTWDGVVAVHPRAQALTLEVILELVLGVGDLGLRVQLGAVFEALNRPLNNLGLFTPRWLTGRWNPLSHPFWSMMDRLRALLAAQIAATRADPALARREDVLAQLVLAEDPNGRRLSDAELRDELVTLVSAGHDTTATAIAWGADLLAHNPHVVARLREGDRDYLKAAAKEVLRARTVAPVAGARVPLEPFPIGAHVVDRDAIVLVDAYDLHRDPALHPDPHAFRPERFLEAAPDGYSYLPFGGGAHRCLGAALATLELELALETIAMRCELAPAGPPAAPARRSVSLAPANGGRVRVERRAAAPRRGSAAAAAV